MNIQDYISVKTLLENIAEVEIPLPTIEEEVEEIFEQAQNKVFRGKEKCNFYKLRAQETGEYYDR